MINLDICKIVNDVFEAYIKLYKSKAYFAWLFFGSFIVVGLVVLIKNMIYTVHFFLGDIVDAKVIEIEKRVMMVVLSITLFTNIMLPGKEKFGLPLIIAEKIVK